MVTTMGASEQEQNLADLQVQSLKMISTFVFPIGLLWLWLVIWPAVGRQAPLSAWAGSGVLTLSAALAYMARPQRYRVASFVLLVGILCAIYCALLTFRAPELTFLFVPVVIFASILLGERGVVPVALLSGALAIQVSNRYLGLSLYSREVLYPAGMIALTSAASWVSAHNLFTALDWAWQGYKRALDNEREARARRAELRRALHALDEATSRLQRTNQELMAARREAEEARVLKEQFVANVSHELRTPLNIIVGFAELMYLAPETYKGVVWTPDLESDIRELYRASRHLQSLVGDVLDLSRIDAARLPMFREIIDVRTIIRDALETIAPLLRQRGLTYQVHWPENLPQLLIDRTRIRQVLLNLLNNAARFTDRGSITVRAEETDEAVVISVQDTGVGIAPDQIGTVFDKFTPADRGTRRRGGVGLGLAVSREFVKLHGGDIWVESTLGEGSTFYFSLPLPGITLKLPTLQRTPDRMPADSTRSPVVVVDPDPTVAEMLSRYLGDHRVLAAGDEVEAERLIEEEHPLAVIVNRPPDAPLESWLGYPGPASERFRVPVFRCSIPSPTWLKESARFDECLSKPVTRETLNRTLEKYCRRPSTILIVDDDHGFVRLIRRMLKTMSLAGEIMTAYSSAQALRLVARRVPDVILLDLLLPDIDGLALLEMLRRDPALHDTRFVAVTATSYAEEALLRRGGRFTLMQSKGISTGTQVELLHAALQLVRPDYVPQESTASTV